jgi:two-component system NtrC family sensor kinase
MMWMALAVGVVAVVAYWDEQREFAAALADFAGEQAVLAQAVASALRTQLTRVDASASPIVQAAGVSGSNAESRARLSLERQQFLSAASAIERPELARLFVQAPFEPGLAAASGGVLRSATIESALSNGASWVRLGRPEAALLGLPARTAMAGLATVNVGAGRWGIAVVASAQRERDRQVLAQLRLVLSLLFASSLVLAFGGLALRNQGRQMLLSQELAIASLRSERDERLVRADKLATMGALATGIAHEVSTPLGVIMGRAEQLLAKSNGDERSKRAVEAIAEQAERISTIVRGFLALARGDAPHMDHVDPTELAAVALSLVEHRFAKASVHLTLSAAEGLPRVASEPRLMEQVLVNLLINACDACASGGQVELRLNTEGQRVAFIVTDDGAGIRPDAAQRSASWSHFSRRNPWGRARASV